MQALSSRDSLSLYTVIIVFINNYLQNNPLPTDKITPFPKQQILDSSILEKKNYADDNSYCDENYKKFSERVENTVGKGEIACNDQFLLLPQCFQKTCNADT